MAVKEDITPLKHSEKKLRQVNRKLQIQLKEIQRLQTELREQAIRDFLTGLYNRRYLNDTLERELARAQRDAYPVSCVIIDIDHFKQVNDTYGHEAGDKVLQNLSSLLTAQTRAGDITCRYGGEEFLLVLPKTNMQEASRIAERCRASFQASAVTSGNTEVRTTFSAGVATYPAHGATSDEILVAADNAMYQAKAQGRNRVIAWQVTK